MKPHFPRYNDTFITPSVLSADFTRLRQEIKSVEKHSGWIQVDIMDGHFVPNLSFGPHIASNIRKITNLPIDAHLMVERPLNFIDSFKSAGVDLISCHIESKDFIKAIQRVKSIGLKAGLALNPNTSFSKAIKYIGQVDLILIMTVNPGFGGQKFIEDMRKKIAQAYEFKKNKSAKFYIQVDGGVNASKALDCVKLGVNSLVMGSALFKEKNPSFIRHLNSEIKKCSLL